MMKISAKQWRYGECRKALSVHADLRALQPARVQRLDNGLDFDPMTHQDDWHLENAIGRYAMMALMRALGHSPCLTRLSALR